MRVTELLSDRLTQRVLALATAILAVDIVVGWAVGAFDRTSRSATLAGVALNALLAIVAAVSAGIAAYQWRKRKESDQFILDIAEKIQQPRLLGPPLVPDPPDYGAPGLNSARLSGLFIEARAKAQACYSDAEAHALAVMTSVGEVPSVRSELEFFSPHAGKAVQLHWDNYQGMCDGHPGRNVSEPPAKRWTGIPWERHPAWERGYRLAFEKAQPIPAGHTVITVAKEEMDGLWHFGFPSDRGTSRTYGLVDDDGNVKPALSVYIARLDVLEAFRHSARQAGICSLRSSTNSAT